MKRFSIFLVATLVWADGGTLQLRKPAGPWIVSVFSTPAPLRMGSADLSVLVQSANDQKPVLDAQVKLHLTKSSASDVVEIVAPASRSQATNKLLYAARIRLPSAGLWRLAVEVTDKYVSTSISGQIHVLSEQAPLDSHWFYIALVPLLVMLFVMNQWLKRNRRLRRSRARP